MIKRIIKCPKTSFFLLGPRGTGKSTWLHARFKNNAYFIDLLDESLYQEYLRDISLFSAELEPLKPGTWVCIDEIQRLPGLLNEVHRLIERKKLLFVLTGSSARKLRRGGVNLLGGRAAKKLMYPFVPEELSRSRFDLRETLQFGTLPLVWASEDKNETLRAYVQMYFKEEIQAEAIVRNLPAFSRFLPVAGLFHGQLLNTTTLARDAGVARTTVNGYLDILEDTLIAYRLHSFSGNLRSRERKHPKLYWIDPGIVRAVKNQYGQVAIEEKGFLFEGWISMLLRFYGEHFQLFDDIYYWAPVESKNIEVDFLLKRGRQFIAIEVKAAERMRPEYLRGLKAIAPLKGVKRRILIYTGKKILKTPDSIEIIPLKNFLKLLEENEL